MECLRNPGKNKRILFVGEGNFSFSCNLTENWDMGTLSVLATCYESELRLLVIDILKAFTIFTRRCFTLISLFSYSIGGW